MVEIAVALERAQGEGSVDVDEFAVSMTARGWEWVRFWKKVGDGVGVDFKTFSPSRAEGDSIVMFCARKEKKV